MAIRFSVAVPPMAGSPVRRLEPQPVWFAGRAPVDVVAEEVEELSAPFPPVVRRPDFHAGAREQVRKGVGRNARFLVVERAPLRRRVADNLRIGLPPGLCQVEQESNQKRKAQVHAVSILAREPFGARPDYGGESRKHPEAERTVTDTPDSDARAREDEWLVVRCQLGERPAFDELSRAGAARSGSTCAG